MELARPPAVYGHTTFDHAGLVVVDEARAVRLADEIDAVKACTTLGEVRAIAAGLTEGGSPVDLAGAAGRDDAEPFDWLACDGFLAGTWPPLPTTEVERCVRRFVLGELMHLAQMERRDYGQHGAGWHIDEFYGVELVRAVRDLDARSVRYDGDLVRRLCWPDADHRLGL